MCLGRWRGKLRPHDGPLEAPLGATPVPRTGTGGGPPFGRPVAEAQRHRPRPCRPGKPSTLSDLPSPRLLNVGWHFPSETAGRMKWNDPRKPVSTCPTRSGPGPPYTPARSSCGEDAAVRGHCSLTRACKRSEA